MAHRIGPPMAVKRLMFMDSRTILEQNTITFDGRMLSFAVRSLKILAKSSMRRVHRFRWR
jgi:hypothetical protein